MTRLGPIRANVVTAPQRAAVREMQRLAARPYYRRRYTTVIRGESTIQRALRLAREPLLHVPVGHVNRYAYDVAVHADFHRRLKAAGWSVES